MKMSKSVKSQFNWFFIHEKMDPDSEYEEVDVIVPETNALIEKAMARMGVRILYSVLATIKTNHERNVAEQRTRMV